jgi:hypothetical protein
MRRRLVRGGAALALVAAALGAPGAQAAIVRDCRAVPLATPAPLPAEALPYHALTAAHARAVAVEATPIDGALLRTPFERGGRFNEIEGGAVVIALTKERRPAKLVVTSTGPELMIREFTTFSPEGERVAGGTDVRLAAGGGLDLDQGRVATTAGAADIRWIETGRGPAVSPANGARLALLVPRIAIPVTAHFMTRRGSPVDPAQFVTPEGLGALFAPDGPLNRIWHGAGLLFVVAGAEACTYSIADFLPEQPPEQDGIPAPTGDCRSLFRRINLVHDSPLGAAGADPAYGADLYLWMRIGRTDADNLFAYAAQHRADGPNPGPGAAWVNAARCLIAGAACGRLLAHELGHFLGLCHACLTELTPPGERGACGFCTNVPACGAGESNLLMRDDAAGDVLTAGEVARARQKALEHRWRGGAP